MRSFLVSAVIIAITFLNVPVLIFPLRRNPRLSDSCVKPVEPRTLRSDQMTVVINGYSEHRIPLLRSIAATYSAAASVSSVVVLWCNPSTPPQTLSQLHRNLSLYSSINAPISVLTETTPSLNSRFYPRKSINTRAILICDDDVELDTKSIDFAFSVWKSNPHRLIGFFARSHAYDLTTKSWIYTVNKDRYSMVLTKAVVINHEYLWEYTCEGGKAMENMRKFVDEAQNCEDILMNFVVADKVNAGPILVGAEKVRDWGDARNEGGVAKEERDVGLSSRRGEHRKRRGGCITEFHRTFGRVPLRFAYGKAVNSIGEPGLCEKAGKLVFCDQQVF